MKGSSSPAQEESVRHDDQKPGLLLRSVPAVLALVASGLSIYLLVLSLTDGGSPLGCGNESALDCSDVLKSRWSTWLGMPVSLPSAILYLAIAVIAPLAGPWLSSGMRKFCWATLVGMATIAIGGSLWFLGLQLFAIEGICVYCLAIHALGMLSACFIFILAPLRFHASHDEHAHHHRAHAMASLDDSIIAEPDQEVVLTLKDFAGVVIAGLGALAFFSLTQIATLPEPQTYVVETYEDVNAPSDGTAKDADDPMAMDARDELDRPLALKGFDAAAELDPRLNDDASLPPPNFDPTPKDSASSEKPGKDPVNESSALEKSGEADSSLFEKSPEQSSAEKAAEKEVSDKRTSDSLLNEAFFLRDSTGDTDNPFPPKSEVNPPEGSLRILGGKATIDYDQVMYLGRADAPFVVVKLFDYTCSHCRDMHGYLEVARRRYGGQLGIVLIPVPLNRDCNPTVRATAPQHGNACDYAKVALGVWKHRRDQFAAFHDWLFAPSRSHAPSKVKARATQILGEETFEGIAVDLEIARQLNQGVELYQTMGTGVIPKLIMGKGVLAGIVTDSSQLFKELETHLQIRPLRTE